MSLLLPKQLSGMTMASQTTRLGKGSSVTMRLREPIMVRSTSSGFRFIKTLSSFLLAT